MLQSSSRCKHVSFMSMPLSLVRKRMAEFPSVAAGSDCRVRLGAVCWRIVPVLGRGCVKDGGGGCKRDRRTGRDQAK